MGIFISCCKPSAASDVRTPDAETRRRQQVEAADKRRQQEAARGIKEPARVQRKQEKMAEMEKRELELEKQGGTMLKWTSN